MLREAGTGVAFVTNNAARTPDEVAVGPHRDRRPRSARGCRHRGKRRGSPARRAGARGVGRARGRRCGAARSTRGVRTPSGRDGRRFAGRGNPGGGLRIWRGRCWPRDASQSLAACPGWRPTPMRRSRPRAVSRRAAGHSSMPLLVRPAGARWWPASQNPRCSSTPWNVRRRLGRSSSATGWTPISLGQSAFAWTACWFSAECPNRWTCCLRTRRRDRRTYRWTYAGCSTRPPWLRWTGTEPGVAAGRCRPDHPRDRGGRRSDRRPARAVLYGLGRGGSAPGRVARVEAALDRIGLAAS